MTPPYPYIDTNIIVRLLTGDDPAKQQAAQRLFEQVEQGTLAIAAPDTVIADAVFVLHSPRLYNISRSDVAALLTPLVQLSHFLVQNKPVVLRALEIYGAFPSGFGDAMILAAMEQDSATELYTYDDKLGKTPGITRKEP